MNTNPSAGLSSCRMTSSPAGGNVPPAMLRLADHCPDCQPFAVSAFRATATVVSPPSPAENPFSIATARKSRDHAKRRPACRAA